ncbi:MAG: hypothetical protein AAFR40_13760, partial [Pseudomonadota bacterium]
MPIRVLVGSVAGTITCAARSVTIGLEAEKLAPGDWTRGRLVELCATMIGRAVGLDTATGVSPAPAAGRESPTLGAERPICGRLLDALIDGERDAVTVGCSSDPPPKDGEAKPDGWLDGAENGLGATRRFAVCSAVTDVGTDGVSKEVVAPSCGADVRRPPIRAPA